ncbi:type I restriction enzyme S subunit [Psychrobacter sp. PL19]|uniref:restriction endonuclease subunit S n=1 Tax=Psychrobacter sp. PL19 TaxID=2760711 RepID=UPI001AEA9587
MAELVTKYRQYAEYKDSGVLVLGFIPNQWITSKLAYTFLKANAGEVIDKTYWGNGKETLYTCNKTPLLSDYIGFPEEKRTTKNDLLLTRNGTPYVHKPVENSIYSNVVQRITLSSDFDRNYLSYCLGNSALSLKGYGVSIESFNFETWKSMQFAVPSMKEQKKIVDFLDHETIQIDTLIEKQQTLIQLLKEKRQAVISHAVTKGLNPDVPMKDSGVEWLGDVPEHWQIVPVKHISKIRYGIGEPPKYQEEGIPLIRATNIRSGKISEAGLVFVNSDDIPENRIVWLDKGDIIVVRSGAGTGDSSIIPSKYKGSIAGFDMVVRATGCLPEFLGYVLLSNYVRNSQFDLEKTRAAQPHLNAEELGDSFIILPKDKEQKLIVEYIDREILKFDKLVTNAQSAVQLMQERRTALISSAVTGKIDVRSWEAPDNI